ncbi:hypothetical protein KIN20_038377 [Parelaphostrongylus tenuis]|uniref:Uncharacterized protein n=1 Tax=Parelaphostrongylus tenuis TaxID=148309 RepID=A0AAD5MCR9_PARTN|nr:hypothetical protein KIN20_038377 [Parelaphostrongylus tenuis]
MARCGALRRQSQDTRRLQDGEEGANAVLKAAGRRPRNKLNATTGMRNGKNTENATYGRLDSSTKSGDRIANREKMT